MIEHLLKINSTKLLVILVTSTLLLNCRSNQNSSSTPKELKKTQKIKIDTIFFKIESDSIFKTVEKKDAHFFRILVDSSSLGYNYFDYSTYQFSPHVYEPVETGTIKKLYEISPKKAIANGKWIEFGNDTHPSNLKYHKIGYYKNGVKDSIWYVNYEDGWDMYFYYKKGVPIDYNGTIKFYGYKDSLVAEGAKFLKTGFPIGVWKYYKNNEVIEHEYIHKKDSIIVNYINYDRKTNKILEQGAYIASKYAEEIEYREYKK